MEFVLVMPLLFVLIMGVLQVAQVWTARQVTHYAAFCAARATLVANGSQVSARALASAKQVCGWMAFSDDGGNALSVAGWGTVPHSAELDKRVRATVKDGSAIGAPWLSGAEVSFDFNLLIPVAGTMMGWLAKHGSAGTDYRPVSGWTGQHEHGQYGGPYITLTETVWLPKPYSTRRYPSGAD